jgi:hypothetical protein
VQNDGFLSGTFGMNNFDVYRPAGKTGHVFFGNVAFITVEPRYPLKLSEMTSSIVVSVRRATHYRFQHEPCWYARKKNAPWFGRPGENSTIWDSPSPKFIMGGGLYFLVRLRCGETVVAGELPLMKRSSR